jgi:hypothetical protein
MLSGPCSITNIRTIPPGGNEKCESIVAYPRRGVLGYFGASEVSGV